MRQMWSRICSFCRRRVSLTVAEEGFNFSRRHPTKVTLAMQVSEESFLFLGARKPGTTQNVATFKLARTSSMTIGAAVRLSPLSCRASHPPRRSSSNDEVACQLRSLKVDPVQTVVPLLCPHQLFPNAQPWFRPTPGSATNCGSPVSESFTE